MSYTVDFIQFSCEFFITTEHPELVSILTIWRALFSRKICYSTHNQRRTSCFGF